MNSRPIVLVSNSSWYLYHYRKLLIKELTKEKHHILAIAPYDLTSKYLSSLLIHIPWMMSRSRNQNLVSFLKSFLRMLLLIRAIKPKLIHSHTLQANLITSIIGSFFGINCVFSFAGIGKFTKSNRLSKFFFKNIIKVIIFFNNYQRKSRFLFKPNKIRSIYIFQNQNDINFFKKELPQINNSNIHLIHGSGIPNIYISKANKFKKNSNWLKNYTYLNPNKIIKEITFIYCARLLKTKGILIFIELSKIFPKSKFLIFGSQDNSTKDSLTNQDILNFKKKHQNIIFMNNVKDPLLSINSKFPILIVPSLYGEGFPRGVVEANTLSIPVITSKDTAQRIPIKKLIYISKNDTPNGYDNCIKQIIKDYKNKNLNRKLEEAREESKKKFSEKLIVQKTLKIYSLFKKTENKSYLLNKDKRKINNWLSQ